MFKSYRRKSNFRNTSEIFLEKYRWSSFLDYIGKKNFPSVTSRELFLDFFEGEKKYLEHFPNKKVMG
ncbi:MAG: hypothetical protein AAB526_02805 [Patescibacteria group bacterium]